MRIISQENFCRQKYYFYGLKKINENNCYLFIKLFNQIQIINIYVKESDTLCQLKYKKILQEKFNEENKISRLGDYLNNQLSIKIISNLIVCYLCLIYA